MSSPRGTTSNMFEATGRMIRPVRGSGSMVITTPGMYFVRSTWGGMRSQCIKSLCAEGGSFAA